MNFIGQNHLLEIHALFPQRRDQLHGIRERHIAVIIAMNQQYR